MLSLVQEGPAQTGNYMIAGYAVIFGVMALYLVSLVVRWRNSLRDLEMLQGLDKEEPLS